MTYKILADIVVLIHFSWILFLIFGAFWGVRRRTVKIFHISGLTFAILLVIFDWYCPLTHLEVWLRARHDPSTTYAGSFIAYYMERLIYLEAPRHLISLLTVFLCGFNAWVYLRKKRYA
jgi:hypothetical protein